MSHARLSAWSTCLGKKFDGASAVAVLADAPGYFVAVNRELDATGIQRLESTLRSLGVHTWHWRIDDGTTKVRAYTHTCSWYTLLRAAIIVAVVTYFAFALAAWYDVHAFAQALAIWTRQRWGPGVFQVQKTSVQS